MSLRITLVLTVFVIVFFTTLLNLIKSKKMAPSSSLFWLFMGLWMITIPVFNKFYFIIAVELLGFAQTSDLIFILLIGFLMLYAIHATIKQKATSDKTQLLISRLSIIENELLRLKNDKKNET